MEFFTALSVLAAICVSGGVGFYLNKHLNAKKKDTANANAEPAAKAVTKPEKEGK